MTGLRDQELLGSIRFGESCGGGFEGRGGSADDGDGGAGSARAEVADAAEREERGVGDVL